MSVPGPTPRDGQRSTGEHSSLEGYRSSRRRSALSVRLLFSIHGKLSPR